MKWFWGDLLIRFIATMIAALVLSFIAGSFVDSDRPAEAPDFTSAAAPTGTNTPRSHHLHMALGGVAAVLLLAFLGGWKRWNLKMVTVIAILVAGLYGGSPTLGILSSILTAATYLAAAKVHDIVYYYLAPAKASSPESE